MVPATMTLCHDGTVSRFMFAAGDCCSFPRRLYGKRIRLAAWRNAQRQDAAAAANMPGANRPYEDVPWFWSGQYDETLQVAGFCREEDVPAARNLGRRASSSTLPPRDAWSPYAASVALVTIEGNAISDRDHERASGSAARHLPHAAGAIEFIRSPHPLHSPLRLEVA